MKKNFIFSYLLVAFSLLLSVASCGSATTPVGSSKPNTDSDRHVVILSMDGFRWDYTLD